MSLKSAVVLVGGLGTRLAGVHTGPKALAPVAGRPFVEHLLRQLRSAGITDVVACTGHLADQVEAALGPTVRYSREPLALGTGGALKLAEHLLADRFFVLNGDSYVDLDLQALARFHEERQARATLACVRVPDTGRFGAIVLDETGRVERFAEKQKAGPGLINAGVYVFERTVLDPIPSGRAVSLEAEVFPRLLGSLYGFAIEARFIDIGTPASLEEAQRFFA